MTWWKKDEKEEKEGMGREDKRKEELSHIAKWFYLQERQHPELP